MFRGPGWARPAARSFSQPAIGQSLQRVRSDRPVYHPEELSLGHTTRAPLRACG